MWTSPRRTVEVRTSGSKISKIAFSNCFPCEEQGGGRILSPQLSWDILVIIMEFEVAGASYTCGQEVHTQLHVFFFFFKKKRVCPLMDHKAYLL